MHSAAAVDSAQSKSSLRHGRRMLRPESAAQKIRSRFRDVLNIIELTKT
jgi:hypothetical protein